MRDTALYKAVLTAVVLAAIMPRAGAAESADIEFFDDFDSTATVDGSSVLYTGNNWEASRLGDEPEGAPEWFLDANSDINPTIYFTALSYTYPWEATLTSRVIDARDLDEEIYLTCYLQKRGVNSTPDDSGDFLALEYSEEGSTEWHELHSFCSTDYQRNFWDFHRFDLTPLCGKTFRVRWRAYGEGRGMLTWNLDYVGVQIDRGQAAPAIVRKREAAEGGVQLEWAGPTGEIDLSYLRSHPIIGMSCAGSEGAPLMTGIKFTAEDMLPYVGMYIGSVSALVYDDPQKQRHSTDVEAVIYENGEEIRREAFARPVTSAAQRMVPERVELAEQVEIRPDSEYLIAISIENYEASNAPIYFQVFDSFVRGKSDLYSEDGGKTWGRMSDVYPSGDGYRQYGRAIWSVAAGLTFGDAELYERDDMLMGYNVYRDGERVNVGAVYYPSPRFTDLEGNVSSDYRVEAFYADGRVSQLSASAWGAGVSDIDREGKISTGLYDFMGRRVSGRSDADLRGLESGIYIEVKRESGRQTTRKILIN